jgi:hypothetical protein
VELAMTRRKNKKPNTRAPKLDVQPTTDVQIVTREIVQLADVILGIVRHEAASGSVRGAEA